MLMERSPILYKGTFRNRTFVERERKGCWDLKGELLPFDGGEKHWSAKRIRNVPFVGGL